MLDKRTKQPLIRGFLSDVGNTSKIQTILDNTVSFLTRNTGRYDTDGTFHPNAKTLGDPTTAAHAGHKMVRRTLLGNAVYAQGLSFVFDRMSDFGVFSDEEELSIIFDETNINRSFVLLNVYFKHALKLVPSHEITLSAMTAIGVSNTTRNRERVRKAVAPVLNAYGLWTMTSLDDNRALFSAGPLLIKFCDEVMGHMNSFDGGLA